MTLNDNNLEPMPAFVPQDETFRAELCGSDEENFLYIRNCDGQTVNNYLELCVMLDFETSGLMRKPLNASGIVPGAFVLIKIDNYQFCRARVKEKDKFGLITCFKFDNGLFATVLPNQVYSLSEYDLKMPCTTIKCRLEGMELFDGLPILEMAYKLIKMREGDDKCCYEVRVKSETNGIPIVSMVKNGQSLMSQVQKFISKLCQIPLPRPGRMHNAHILYVNSKAMVWLRYVETEGLLGNIEETFEQFRIKNEKEFKSLQFGKWFPVSEKTNVGRGYSNFDFASFFAKYQNASQKKKLVGDIFIAFSKEDGQFYRVRILHLLKRDETLQVEVEYMDYGNKGIISDKYLIPVEQIDENLAFIPPQVLKARMFGFYRMEEKVFWELCPDMAQVVVRDSHWEESDRAPEVEIFNPDDLDVSINEKWIRTPGMHYNSDINPDAVTHYMGIYTESYLKLLNTLPKNGLRKFPKLNTSMKQSGEVS